ncbi:MAG: ABC transporter permease [Bacteroidota bacterium]|nr:ABC transporter permease [Bacteroidota bacterium]
MFKNYFKTAWRSLLRNKVFSTINLVGLAIGMAAALLIGIWVQNEFSYDQFHTNKNNLYKVYNRQTGYGGAVYAFDVTAGPVGKMLQRDFPEVKNTARIYWSIERLFNYGNKSIKAKGNDVDKPFLTMFSFPLLKGNTSHALDDVNSIVITEELAKSLFGNDDPMGKVVVLDNKDSYKITGVLKNLPANTEFDFNYLISLQANENNYGNAWDNNTYYTYIQLKPGVSVDQFNNKIKNEVNKYAPEQKDEVFLYPVTKQHLYSSFDNGKQAGGRINTVRLLLMIGFLILLIACINFMNLSTAQSQKRAKEVGVRKVVGAGKWALISQFLCESVLIAFIAGILSLLIVQLSLPAFNQLIKESLSIDYASPVLWVSLLGFILFTGLLAGSYPAFFLSAFKPVTVLKGALASTKKIFNPRKFLVVTQFSIAIILIISTLIVYREIQYVQNRDTGYNENNLVEVPVEGNIRKNYDIIKSELINKGVVTAMCKNSLGITIDGATSTGYSWQGSTADDKNIGFSRVGADGDFIKTMGLTLLAGRDIDLKMYPYDTTSVMLNEAAIKAMRLKNPVGKYINTGNGNRMIVGVFKNFIIGSPYENVNPMVVLGTNYWTYNIILRFNGKNTTLHNLEATERVFKKYNPAYPFTYHFVDEEFAQKFSSEQQTATLAALFAGLTIFISCLGLFGLAAYMAENRTKEIGIRKVLGASVSSIAQLLSKEFVVLVVISIIIATPIAWMVMNKWLQSYTYRIQIQGWMFVLSGLAAIFIALLTVSFQAIKAAKANPVKSLKRE